MHCTACLTGGPSVGFVLGFLGALQSNAPCLESETFVPASRGASRHECIAWQDSLPEAFADLAGPGQCRSQLENQVPEAVEEEAPPENNFMSAFKVATFDFAKEESPPPPAVAEPAAEPEQFWEQLLKPGFEDIKRNEQQSLGKGRRERKQVQYLVSCDCIPVFVQSVPLNRPKALKSVGLEAAAMLLKNRLSPLLPLRQCCLRCESTSPSKWNYLALPSQRELW